MWWNDIKVCKSHLEALGRRLSGIDLNYSNISDSVDGIYDKINDVIRLGDIEQRVKIAEATLDKFEDYMNNVGKLNVMINEFKGCVSMARAAFDDKKNKNKKKKAPKKTASIKKPDQSSHDQ